MTHKNVIEAVRTALEPDPSVNALWLEGSFSNGSEDQYSDIDLVADVRDGSEARVFEEIERALTRVGPIDFNYEVPNQNEYMRYKIFHIQGTSEHLLIDINIQSHSRNFAFVLGNDYEKPLVLFDKIGVINFQQVNPAKQGEALARRLVDLEAAFYQRTKAIKYIARGKYLEAFVYYDKQVLRPLIELLRLKYTPLASNYYLTHISDHLPQDIVAEVKNLYRATSIEEMAIKLPIAEKLFFTTLRELHS